MEPADPFFQDTGQVEPVLDQPVPEPQEPVTAPEPHDAAGEIISAINPAMSDVQPEMPPAPAPAAPDASAVHEDFIAAARRAAQNAATQRSSILGGLTSLASRSSEPEISSPADPDDKPQSKLGSLFSLPFRRSAKDHLPGDPPPEAVAEYEDEDGGGSKSRRLHLILAGLVLLAAVSAYTFGDAGKRLFSGNDASTDDVAVSQVQDTASVPVMQVAANASAQPETTGRANGPTRIAPVEAISGPSDPAPQASEPPALPQPNLTTASLTSPVPADDAMAGDGQAATPVSTEQVETTGLPAIDAAFSSQTSDTSGLPAQLGSQALRDAASNGDANAQFVVASRYLEGKSVTRDFAKAAEWYRKAADGNLAPAQYRLGTLYERGNGLAKDIMMARMWYERAAEANNVKAMHNLAVIYANNTNNDAQFDKAAKWFRGAADHGLKDSLYNLAVLHERGLGVEQDTRSAYFWFGVAARHGDADAKAKASTLASFLTKAQKTETDAQIAGWTPKKPDAKGNFVAISDPAWQVAVNAPAAPGVSDQALATMSEKDLVLRAQQLLSGMGYDVGPVDGVMGSRTANAVRLFQLQTGAPVNGSVSADLIKLLAARQS
jgi:localization factor PodJL